MAATFSHAFYDIAARSPDRCAFCLPPGRYVTFAALYCLVEAAAYWLLIYGVRPGDAIFLVFPDSVEFVVLWLAVMRCRAVAVPIDPSCQCDNFESCLHTYRPKLLLVGPDGNPAKEAAAAEHGVSHAVASVRYDLSDSVHTSAFVLLKLAGEHLTPLVPASLSRLVNEPKDVALFLSQVDAGPRVPVTQEEFVASIVNSDLAQSRLPPLFQAHSLLRDLVHSLSATLQKLDAEDKCAIESALKLNELALSMSTVSMVAVSMFLMNKNQVIIHTNTWVGTMLLLFFASFGLSLAGIQYHPLLGRSSVYVGKVALFAFFSGVATTVISVLPEKHSLVASVVASFYVVLLTIPIIIRGGAWQLHPRGRIREAAAGMAAAAAAAAAFTQANSTAVAAAAVASPIQASPKSGIWTWFTGRGSRKRTGSMEEEASVQVQRTGVPV